MSIHSNLLVCVTLAIFGGCASGETVDHPDSRRALVAFEGENVLIFRSSDAVRGKTKLGDPPNLTPENALSLSTSCRTLQYVSPKVSIIGGLQFKPGSAVDITGVSPAFFPIRNLVVNQGRLISDADVQSAASVCVIGSQTSTWLFGDQVAVGKTVSVVWSGSGQHPPLSVRIIGVLKRKRAQNNPSLKYDNLALIPWTTAKANARGTLGSDWTIVAKAVSRDKVAEAITEARTCLRLAHKLKPSDPDDFVIEDENSRIEKLTDGAATPTDRHDSTNLKELQHDFDTKKESR